MPALPANTVLPLVGILVQLGASIILTILSLGLLRQSRSRLYFRYWTWGWVALLLAILVVALRYVIVPSLGVELVEQRGGPLLAGFYLLYQVSKFAFLGLLLAGTLVYVRQKPLPRGRIPAGAGTVLGVAVITLLLTQRLNALVMWQAVIAAPLFAVCAWRFGSLPAERQSQGTRTVTVALGLFALQWGLYILAFARSEIPPSGPWTQFLALLSGYNSYLDALLQFVLGVGMVMTLVEDASHEVEVAQAARLQEVAASERRLADILRSAREGIVTLDGECRIEGMNPAAEEMFRVDAAAVRGLSFDGFVAPDQRDRLWADVAIAVRRSEANPPVANRRELVGVRSDGERFPVEISLASLGESERHGYVLILRDLTLQVQAREEKEQLEQHLAHAARLESIGRMVSGVAHELNNPLTAIMAFAQDMLQDDGSDADRDALTVILQQAQRCRIIVGDLLLFSRSRREEWRRMEARELVAGVARVFERDSLRQGVVLDIDVPDTLPPIEVDAVGMEQVLTNLVTNALQATRSGGRVSIRVRAVPDRLEFQVQDDGPGIPPEILPRLFEPFFTTKDPGTGTGLGLSVSHAIVKQHEGAIRVENVDGQLGRGARFTVELPFVDRRREQRSPSPIAAPEAPPEPAARSRTVLVIDDETAIRSAMRRSLERRGWIVEEARDGAEAMLVLNLKGAPRMFDAIVTDLRMPGISGIELYDRIAASHPVLLDRFVVTAGDTTSPAVAEFMARFPNPFLQKPFDMRTLAEVLERVAPMDRTTTGQPAR